MSEKANFFYKQINNQRKDLSVEFTNALLGDITPPILPKSRIDQKQSS